MERKQVELKLQVDGGKNRVMFAECGSDFVDLLFALLTLPLSTILRLTHNRPELGSISKLYESVGKLESGSYHSVHTQAMLLSAYLKPNEEANFCVRFNCESCGFRCCGSSLGNAPCKCGRVMNKPYNSSLPAKSEEEKKSVFVGEGLRFVVTDDLRVMPSSIKTTFSLLHELGVQDCSSFRHQIVNVGVEEILHLLSHSLASKMPLTDAFLQHPSIVLNPFQSTNLVEKARPLKDTMLSYVKMDVNVELKLFFDKSSETILYAEAAEDFVDLVFSFMTFPLGCVVKLLNGKSDVGCIDNLTNSIDVLEKEKYMKPGVDVRKVIHLNHNIGFRLQELALPLAEHLQIPLYAHGEYCQHLISLSRELDLMLNKKFMKGPANFMIMNNLEIVPASPIVGLSMLMDRRVSLNDVQDLVLKIGQEEALTLLKAALKSESALNDFFQAMCRTET